VNVALHIGPMLERHPHGSTRYLQGLMQSLPDVGVDLVTFAAGDPSEHRRHDWPGFVQLGHPFSPARDRLWMRLRLPPLRLDTPVDVVHAPDLVVPPPGRAGLVVTAPDVRIVVDPDALESSARRMLRHGLEVARGEAHTIIVWSEFARAALLGAGFPEERVTVVPPGGSMLAVDERTPAEVRLRRVGVRLPFVLVCGRIGPEIVEVVAAFSRLRAANPALQLVLAGEWAGDGATRATIERDGVRVLGPIDDATLDALMLHTTALLVPERAATFSWSAIEALARGCTPVVARSGALPEVVADAGIVVDPGDVDGWTAAVLELLDTAAGERATTARARAATFDWTSAAKAHAALYADAADGRS
jgi:glycosyltransferase involved in cell wall biosynthesis